MIHGMVHGGGVAHRSRKPGGGGLPCSALYVPQAPYVELSGANIVSVADALAPEDASRRLVRPSWDLGHFAAVGAWPSGAACLELVDASTHGYRWPQALLDACAGGYELIAAYSTAELYPRPFGCDVPAPTDSVGFYLIHNSATKYSMGVYDGEYAWTPEASTPDTRGPCLYSFRFERAGGDAIGAVRRYAGGAWSAPVSVARTTPKPFGRMVLWGGFTIGSTWTWPTVGDLFGTAWICGADRLPTDAQRDAIASQIAAMYPTS